MRWCGRFSLRSPSKRTHSRTQTHTHIQTPVHYRRYKNTHAHANAYERYKLYQEYIYIANNNYPDKIYYTNSTPTAHRHIVISENIYTRMPPKYTDNYEYILRCLTKVDGKLNTTNGSICMCVNVECLSFVCRAFHAFVSHINRNRTQHFFGCILTSCLVCVCLCVVRVRIVWATFY